MSQVLLAVSPVILCQAARAVVSGCVRGAVHVPGAGAVIPNTMYRAARVAVDGARGAVHVPGATGSQSSYLVSDCTCCCQWRCTWCCSCSGCCWLSVLMPCFRPHVLLWMVHEVMSMFPVLLAVSLIILFQVARAAVGVVRGAVYDSGAAGNLSCIRPHMLLWLVYVLLFMFLVLLAVGPNTLHQAGRVAVGLVRGAVHVPGAAGNLS
jgi:hypothetical protein